MKEKLSKLLAHSAIVISLMYFVFFFIDRVNSAMGFINNNITKVLLFILCVLSICNSIRLIALDRRAERRRMKARMRTRNKS